MFMIEIDSESHYATLGLPPIATAAEIRQARDRMVRELRERLRREPDREAELTERITAVNSAGDELARPARRARYDRANPDLRMFAVRDAAAPMFIDPAHRLAALHRAIVEHLDPRSPVRPLSDLDRTDFASDATPNDLLDELTDQWRP